MQTEGDHAHNTWSLVFLYKALEGAALVMLVFDLTDPTSLDGALKWLGRVQEANKDFKVNVVHLISLIMFSRKRNCRAKLNRA